MKNRKESATNTLKSINKTEKRSGFSVDDYTTKSFVKQESCEISDAILALAINSIINQNAKPFNACRHCGKIERLSKHEQLCLRCEQRAEYVLRTYPLVVQRARQFQSGGAK